MFSKKKIKLEEENKKNVSFPLYVVEHLYLLEDELKILTSNAKKTFRERLLKKVIAMCSGVKIKFTLHRFAVLPRFFYKTKPTSEKEACDNLLGFLLFDTSNDNPYSLVSKKFVAGICAKKVGRTIFEEYVFPILAVDDFENDISLDSVQNVVGFYWKLGFDFDSFQRTRTFDSLVQYYGFKNLIAWFDGTSKYKKPQDVQKFLLDKGPLVFTMRWRRTPSDENIDFLESVQYFLQNKIMYRYKELQNAMNEALEAVERKKMTEAQFRTIMENIYTNYTYKTRKVKIQTHYEKILAAYQNVVNSDKLVFVEKLERTFPDFNEKELESTLRANNELHEYAVNKMDLSDNEEEEESNSGEEIEEEEQESDYAVELPSFEDVEFPSFEEVETCINCNAEVNLDDPFTLQCELCEDAIFCGVECQKAMEQEHIATCYDVNSKNHEYLHAIIKSLVPETHEMVQIGNTYISNLLQPSYSSSYEEEEEEQESSSYEDNSSDLDKKTEENSKEEQESYSTDSYIDAAHMFITNYLIENDFNKETIDLVALKLPNFKGFSRKLGNVRRGFKKGRIRRKLKSGKGVKGKTMLKNTQAKGILKSKTKPVGANNKRKYYKKLLKSEKNPDKAKIFKNKIAKNTKPKDKIDRQRWYKNKLQRAETKNKNPAKITSLKQKVAKHKSNRYVPKDKQNVRKSDRPNYYKKRANKYNDPKFTSTDKYKSNPSKYDAKRKYFNDKQNKFSGTKKKLVTLKTKKQLAKRRAVRLQKRGARKAKTKARKEEKKQNSGNNTNMTNKAINVLRRNRNTRSGPEPKLRQGALLVPATKAALRQRREKQVGGEKKGKSTTTTKPMPNNNNNTNKAPKKTPGLTKSQTKKLSVKDLVKKLKLQEGKGFVGQVKKAAKKAINKDGSGKQAPSIPKPSLGGGGGGGGLFIPGGGGGGGGGGNSSANGQTTVNLTKTKPSTEEKREEEEEEEEGELEEEGEEEEEEEETTTSVKTQLTSVADPFFYL